MRLIDADALLDWFDDQSDVIATTDVQALIDNWPTVSCGECNAYAEIAELTEMVTATGEVFWTHGWRKRAEKAEAELESIKKRSGDWTVTERKLEVERSLRRKMAERLKRYEDGLGAKDHFLIRAQQAEAQLDALLEANANNGLELMDEVGKRKLAEAELAKAPTWATVEALQEQLKASEAKFQRCLKSENAARSALARSEAEVARLNKLDTTYHHD